MEEKFAIALSEKDGEEALKEISLKIKSTFPREVKYLLIFFTPHYSPPIIPRTINFTLKPRLILGVQSPFLIFEDRIIEKGVVACCINKNEAEIKDIFLKTPSAQKESTIESEHIESSLRSSLKGLARKNNFSVSFLSYQRNPHESTRALELSLGKMPNVFGAGFMKRYGAKNYLMVNNDIDEGFLDMVGKGLEIQLLKIGGFLPIGRPFSITRALPERNMILEINNEPAINIYKKYLGTKFDLFKKNYLFPLYPLGIKQKDSFLLITVTNCLEDGSLLCVGDIKETQEGHIMVFHPPSLLNTIKEKLNSLSGEKGLLLAINSLARKKILKDTDAEEIRFIKNSLGVNFKVFGAYFDYSIFADENTRVPEWETANLLMAVVK